MILILTILTTAGCSAATGVALSNAGPDRVTSDSGNPSDSGSEEEPGSEKPDPEGTLSGTATVIEVPETTAPVAMATDTDTAPEDSVTTDTDAPKEPQDEEPEEEPQKEPPEEPSARPDGEDPAGGEGEVQGAGEPGSTGSGEPLEEDPAGETEDIKSNLPAELKAELDQPGNGILLVYHPEQYEEIKAITRWTVVEFETETQLFLVTKAKGSIVEVAGAELTDDERVVIPGEVIRNWQTTSDYEVIRIHYTDADTIPLNFVRVRQPDGKVTLAPLQTSGKDDYDWLAFQYEERP